MTQAKRQSGFSFIELLVAIVVLGIGLLGLAALQTLGVRYTHTSYLLAAATQQAEDMIERMRANPFEANKTGGYYDAISGTTTAPKDCVSNACDQEERAKFDHQEWGDKNLELLGQAGKVTRNGDVFEVELKWSEVNYQGGTDAKEYTVVFRP